MTGYPIRELTTTSALCTIGKPRHVCFHVIGWPVFTQWIDLPFPVETEDDLSRVIIDLCVLEQLEDRI
jgi:hypothetical protein